MAEEEESKPKLAEEAPSEFKKPEFKVPEPKSAVEKPPEQKPHPEPSVPKAPSQPFKYEEPSWAALPPVEKKYQLEVIKSGTIIEPVELSQRRYYVVGRMADCHIPLQHPSLSRYHAVLQYCNPKLGRDPSLRDGWYIQDLGSSNGTVVNKKRLEPNQYRPLDIGHVIKFGMSTRIYVLQGKQEEEEEEEEKEPPQRHTQIPDGLKVRKVPKPKVPPAPKPNSAPEGCMWGIAMDDEEVYESAEADPNFAEDSDSSSEDEAGEKKERKPLDLSDPKKTLRVFYEREDLGLPEYQMESIGKNRHRAFIEIPTGSSGGGKTIRVEGEGGGKKEAVAACAREACIVLDKMDILRPRNKLGRKNEVKKDWAANDYYDEEEDSFYDRTGDLEQKRLQRMKRERAEKMGSTSSGSGAGQVHTEQSLQIDLERLEAEIRQISGQLEEDERKRAEFAATRAPGKSSGGELDALDEYMSALKEGVAMDATTRTKLKHRLLEAQKERSRCERLLSIAKGPKMPASLMANAWQTQTAPVEAKKEPVPTSGALIVGKLPRNLPPVKFVSSLPKLDAFEDEDDEDLGVGKPKLKKLVAFLKEEVGSSGKAPKKLKEDEKVEVPKESDSSSTGEKMDQDDEKVEGESEPDDPNKKVYSVFLPPELKQSLDEHADEVDQIWDVDRAARLAKTNDNEQNTA